MSAKFLKFGMAALMTLSLTACSSSSASTGSASGSASSDGGAIKLGFSGPLTGNAAIYGTAVKNATELAVNEINKEGKVKFEYRAEDDKADGESAVNAFNTLVDWGMQVSLGTVTSGTGQAVSPLYQQENIFALTPSASSVGVIYSDMDNQSGPYGNIFQMCFTDPNQGTASAQYLADHTDLGSKIAIIWKNDDNYSTGIHDNFVSKAEELGLEIVADETFTEQSATDFSVQVGKAQDAGADIVFLPIYYQPATLILQEAQKQGYTPTFFGCDGMDGILDQNGFDASLAEGLYMLTPFSADSTEEKSAAFVKAYEEAYNETPNQFAADAYDAVYAIAQAVENTGVNASDSASDICDALKGEFPKMEFDGITGKNVSWSETGEVTKDPRAIVIQDGKYVSAE